jgi:AraC family transcriptional regulator, regulatory protein of adaptative response / methylated-DNA-[protein]-cysteine methyltransferase
METLFYSFGESHFWEYIIATDDLGISDLIFITDRDSGRDSLEARYPRWVLKEKVLELHEKVGSYFRGDLEHPQFPLSLKGKEFQISVWRALQDIPYGTTVTYRDIAVAVGRPRALRAVGTAIGANPIAYIIPCHRVIRSDGTMGGYRWWFEKKELILAYEGLELVKK